MAVILKNCLGTLSMSAQTRKKRYYQLAENFNVHHHAKNQFHH